MTLNMNGTLKHIFYVYFLPQQRFSIFESFLYRIRLAQQPNLVCYRFLTRVGLNSLKF